MNYILFDEKRARENLKPFTFTRPVADIRIGILTIREKWEKYVGATTSTWTEKYLSGKFPLKSEKENVLINGSVLPDPMLVKEITGLKTGEKLVNGENTLAICLDDQALNDVKNIEDAEVKSTRSYAN